MVSSNSSFEDKSPSPKPFKEPDNMFTIDLDKTEYYTNETKEEIFKIKKKNISKTIILAGGTLFLCLFLTSTFLLLLHEHIRGDTKINGTSTFNAIPFNVLLRNKDNFLQCNKTLPFQECCYLFFQNQLERCTWDNVLSFFVKYELEVLQRYKRQTYEEYYQPNYEYSDVNFDYTLPQKPSEDLINEYYSDDNFNDNNYASEQEGVNNESELHNNKFISDENYLLREEHDVQINPNSKLKNLCPDENCPEVVKATTKILEITNIASTPKSIQIDVNNTNIKISSDFQSKERKSQGRIFNVNKSIYGIPSSIQNKELTPCVYSLNSPFLSTPPSSYANYFMEQQPFYVMNPPVYSYIPPQPINIYPKPAFAPGNVFQTSSGNGGGPFYMCNPTNNVGMTAANSVGSSEDDNIREAYNLQDLLETLPKPTKNNKTREAIECPIGARSCIDGSKCIHQRQICDNEVNCKDASDELDCSCRARVGEIRACDGYLDCPDGEDEQNCFNCREDEFSCDDWSRFQPGTCVPMSQRCDGIKQCEITGRDEEDCSILTNHIGHQSMYKISNAVGFLHRNFKGKWYPTCFDYFAAEVCKTEAGPSNIPPRSHLIATNDNYPGPFLDVSHTGQLTLSEMCIENKAAFVECPAIFCGIRFIINNPFRASEIDTSAEDLLNHLQRYSQTRKAETASNTRVVGGKPSQPTSWPWVVSIYKNGIFHCGGVIIDELWVLTAAHCVDRFWFFYYEIQAGMLRRFSYSPMEQIRWATVAIPHEDYSKKSLKNDIALIKLSKPVRFNRYVRPICLPSEATAGDNFLRGPTPNTVCITVGWGATVEHGADPDHLREVEIPILPHCKHTEDREGDEICAGLLEGGRDACQGDSGGPLMCRNVKNHNQWYLAGIVSHGEGCARPNEPGVYTKVSKYLGWISENINGKLTGRSPLTKCPGYICQGTNKCISKKRHCDKIVDCFFGDDELNCWQHQTHSLFRAGLVGSSHSWFNDFLNLINMFNTSTTDQPYKPTSAERDHIEKIPKHSSRSNNASETMSFRCSKLLQIIPLKEKCNKVINCEDGTDETDCRCADYLKKSSESAICDGITDCKDLSDEAFCEFCSADEFLCRIDQKCIPLTHRCDGKPTCVSGEDEWDCVALTDGKTLTLDSDLRPKQHMKGIITINRFGVWRPLCTNAENTASIATNACNLLGFEEYTAFHTLSVQDKPLNVTIEGVEQNDSVEAAFACNGLYIICVNTSFSNIHHLEINRGELYTLPWSAAIYSDGQFNCIGTILNSYWIIAPGSCLPENSFSYITVLLGKGKAHLDIEGPHEQIILISKFASIKRNEAIILRCEQRIFFSRYIKPTPLTTKSSSYAKEQCVAITFSNQKSQLIVLETSKNCSLGFLCFNSTNTCLKVEYSNSGVITCNGRNGWYPAAIFNQITNTCDFSKIVYSPLNKTEIEFAMGNNLIQINAKPCDGFRCLLGQCIGNEKVCNGVSDCRGGEDEAFELCATKTSMCHLHSNCTNFSGCEFSEFKCKNGKCVPKTAFCDSKDDCGDLFDEPATCSCKTYMETVHPEKICDGIVNCWDHSDEDPKNCGCQNNHNITCGDSSFCISSEMLCDGFSDCPNDDDEKNCYMLRTNIKRKNSGEVLLRTAGIWHSGCFSRNLTTSFLEKTCQRLGFAGTSATRMETPPGKNLSSRYPVLDHFDFVSIRRGLRKIKLSLRLRTGSEPYVKFIEDSKCYKLYIECW